MNVILIDDEQLALNYLAHQLNCISNVHIVGKYTNPLVGKEAVASMNVDIVFLDIDMRKMNGMALAEKLLEMKPKLSIVFVTAYDEYAIKAFELNVADYILKPASEDRLQKTVNRIRYEKKFEARLCEDKIESVQVNLFHRVTFKKITGTSVDIIPMKWRTKKTNQLFLYLLVHRGEVINKAALVELLWADLATEKAYQQLYTAVYYIRKTLVDLSAFFQVNSLLDGYMLSLNKVKTDIEWYDSFMESDIALTKSSRTSYERAIKVISDDFLKEYDYPWAEVEREKYRTHWMKTALKLVEYYYQIDEIEKGVLLEAELLKRYPFEENVYFYLMKIHKKRGVKDMVLTYYERLSTVLLAELQVQPSNHIIAWVKNNT